MKPWQISWRSWLRGSTSWRKLVSHFPYTRWIWTFLGDGSCALAFFKFFTIQSTKKYDLRSWKKNYQEHHKKVVAPDMNALDKDVENK